MSDVLPRALAPTGELPHPASAKEPQLYIYIHSSVLRAMPPKNPVRKTLKQTGRGPKMMTVKPSDTVQKTVHKCFKDFRLRFYGASIYDYNAARRALRRLGSRCCWAHHELATVPLVILQLDCLLEGRDYVVHFTRDKAFPNDSDWEGMESYVKIPEMVDLLPLPPPRVEDARNMRAPPGFEEAFGQLAGGGIFGGGNAPEPPPEEEQADEEQQEPESSEESFHSPISSPEEDE